MFGKYILLVLATLPLVACADADLSTPGQRNLREKGASDQSTFISSLPESHLTVWGEWEIMPTADKVGALKLVIGNPSNLGRPIPVKVQGDVAVVLWMPSMGHGSSPVTVRELSPGVYHASNVLFSMPGDWEIRIQRRLNGVVIEQAIIPIRI